MRERRASPRGSNYGFEYADDIVLGLAFVDRDLDDGVEHIFYAFRKVIDGGLIGWFNLLSQPESPIGPRGER